MMQTSPEKPHCDAALTVGPVRVSCATQAGHRATIHIGKAVLEDGREVTVSWRADRAPEVLDLVG